MSTANLLSYFLCAPRHPFFTGECKEHLCPLVTAQRPRPFAPHRHWHHPPLSSRQHFGLALNWWSSYLTHIMAMYKVSQKKVRIEKIITKIKCFGAKFSHLVIEPVHSGSSNIFLVYICALFGTPCRYQTVHIRLIYIKVPSKQSLFYFVQSQEYRSEAGSTSRRHNLRVVGKKWEVCNSSELRQSSRRQQAFLWSPRTIGTLQLLTNKFLKLLHSHTGSDTAHHILIPSSADKELSCQFFP